MTSDTSARGDLQYDDRDVGCHWFDHAAWIARCRVRCPHLYTDHAEDYVDVLCWAFEHRYRDFESRGRLGDGNDGDESAEAVEETTEQTTLVTDGGAPTRAVDRGTTQTRFDVEDDRGHETTGIDISGMAAFALEIDLPLLWWTPEDVDDAVLLASLRTTEYAVRDAAPGTPSRPKPEEEHVVVPEDDQTDVEEVSLDAFA